MDTSTQLGRIQNAHLAMSRARNPKFRMLWYNIANTLVAVLDPGQPWLRTYDGKLN